MQIQIEPEGADSVEVASEQADIRDIEQEIVPAGPVGPPGDAALSVHQLTLTAKPGHDLNQSSWTAIPWGSSVYTDSRFSFDLASNPTEVTVERDGWYEIHANAAYQDVSSSRINIQTRIYVNGSQVAGEGKGAYSRNREKSTEGSSAIKRTLNLSDGDVVTIRTKQEASSGTAEVDPDGTVLEMRSLVGRQYSVGDADSLNGYTASDFLLGLENEGDGFLISENGSLKTQIEFPGTTEFDTVETTDLLTDTISIRSSGNIQINDRFAAKDGMVVKGNDGADYVFGNAGGQSSGLNVRRVDNHPSGPIFAATSSGGATRFAVYHEDGTHVRDRLSVNKEVDDPRPINASLLVRADTGQSDPLVRLEDSSGNRRLRFGSQTDYGVIEARNFGFNGPFGYGFENFISAPANKDVLRLDGTGDGTVMLAARTKNGSYTFELPHEGGARSIQTPGQTEPLLDLHDTGANSVLDHSIEVPTPTTAPSLSTTGTVSGTTTTAYAIVARSSDGRRTLVGPKQTIDLDNSLLDSSNYVTVDWSSVSNASDYIVLKDPENDGSWNVLGTTSNTTFDDTGQSLSGFDIPVNNETGKMTLVGGMPGGGSQSAQLEMYAGRGGPVLNAEDFGQDSTHSLDISIGGSAGVRFHDGWSGIIPVSLKDFGNQHSLWRKLYLSDGIYDSDNHKRVDFSTATTMSLHAKSGQRAPLLEAQNENGAGIFKVKVSGSAATIASDGSQKTSLTIGSSFGDFNVDAQLVSSQMRLAGTGSTHDIQILGDGTIDLAPTPSATTLIQVGSGTTQPGTASDPAFTIGDSGAGLFINSNGEVVAVDEAGNTTVLT